MLVCHSTKGQYPEPHLMMCLQITLLQVNRQSTDLIILDFYKALSSPS